MMRFRITRPGLLTALATAMISVVGSSTASAQFGMGFGDMMFGNFRTVPSPKEFLNQRATQASARGLRGPTQNRAYGPDANSFHSRSRDNGFVSSGNVSRRRSPTNRPQPARSTSNATKAQAKTDPEPAPDSASYPTLPLRSFFDASLKLSWPAEAPANGDLGEKRGQTDQASRVVLEETTLHQSASLASVADARQKLLDYGRPALHQLRNTSTEEIAEHFHRFLFALYDSLSQSSASTP